MKILVSVLSSLYTVCLLWPCLVHPENQKVFKILRHIECFDTYMKH